MKVKRVRWINTRVEDDLWRQWRALMPFRHRSAIVAAFVRRCVEERLFFDDIERLEIGDYSIRRALDGEAGKLPADSAA